jgi:hypothetical protein
VKRAIIVRVSHKRGLPIPAQHRHKKFVAILGRIEFANSRLVKGGNSTRSSLAQCDDLFSDQPRRRMSTNLSPKLWQTCSSAADISRTASGRLARPRMAGSVSFLQELIRIPPVGAPSKCLPNRIDKPIG